MQKRDNQIMERRQLNRPTIPSLYSDEMSTNPFLRVDVPVIQRTVEPVGMPQPPKHLGA